MVSKLDRMTDFIVDLGSGITDIVSNVDSAAIDLRNLIGKVENGEGALGALIAEKSAYDSMQVVISNLTKTTEAAREGSEAFAENMEALKHNWLFKKYFEERGYWKKSEYERNLETKVENLYRQQEVLDKKILELKQLEEKAKALTN